MKAEKFVLSVVAGLCLFSLNHAWSADASVSYAPLAPDLTVVPQNLLSLIHAPEVQQELGCSESQSIELEQAMREVDALWWPSRILPAAKQRAVVADQESKIVESVGRILGAEAVQRLRQIELQSQSSRMMVRPEMEQFLGLDAKQKKRLADLFAANDQLSAELAAKKGKDHADRSKAYNQAKQSEPKNALAVLTPTQASRLRAAFGSPFDTSKLERIYPLAPELIDSGYWTDDRHPTLTSLRGKILLIHFYAFQCHNCVANFPHYKRWDEKLNHQEVQVIGIQTPETSSEKDPEKVRAAAAKAGFQFPVVIDVERKNWDAWGNTMWPTVYIIDKRGYVRFWWQGELNWEGATGDRKIEEIVEKLRKES